MASVGELKVKLPDGRLAIFQQKQGVIYSWKIVMELVEIRDSEVMS
jgi:hypothetical protein